MSGTKIVGDKKVGDKKIDKNNKGSSSKKSTSSQIQTLSRSLIRSIAAFCDGRSIGLLCRCVRNFNSELRDIKARGIGLPLDLILDEIVWYSLHQKIVKFNLVSLRISFDGPVTDVCISNLYKAIIRKPQDFIRGVCVRDPCGKREYLDCDYYCEHFKRNNDSDSDDAACEIIDQIDDKQCDDKCGVYHKVESRKTVCGVDSKHGNICDFVRLDCGSTINKFPGEWLELQELFMNDVLINSDVVRLVARRSNAHNKSHYHDSAVNDVEDSVFERTVVRPNGIIFRDLLESVFRLRIDKNGSRESFGGIIVERFGPIAEAPFCGKKFELCIDVWLSW